MDDTIVRLLRAESSSIAGSFFLISMMMPVYVAISVLPWLSRLGDPRLVRSIPGSFRRDSRFLTRRSQAVPDSLSAHTRSRTVPETKQASNA